MSKFSVASLFFVTPSVAYANTNSAEVVVIASLGMAFVVLLVFFALNKADKDASDPSIGSTADQASLPAKLSKILDAKSVYELEIFRQSGNHERSIVGLSGYKVVSEILSTMKRAGIDLVSINAGDDAIQIQRLVHNGRGRQEGKRIGGFVIRRSVKAFVPPSEQPIDVVFDTTGQRLLGLAFRATVKHFDCENDLDIGNDFEDRFFAALDETGKGKFTFKPMELASLLMFSNFILTAEVVMNEELAEEWKPHNYPNMANLLSLRDGKKIKVYELFGETGLKQAQSFFGKLSKQLPTPLPDEYLKALDLKL